jgi:hypothetical protein
VSIYSVQLYGGQVTGEAVVYTAPAGVVIVIRDVETVNVAGAAATYSLDVYGASGFKSALISEVGAAANAHAQWTGRAVLDTGDEIAISSTAYPIGLLISGYSLS